MRVLLAALGGTVAALALAAPAAAADRYGLTPSDRLVRFDDAAPGTLELDVPLTGLGGDADELVSHQGRLIARTTAGRYFAVRQTDGAATTEFAATTTVVRPGTGPAMLSSLFGTPEPTSTPATTDTAPVEAPRVDGIDQHSLSLPGGASVVERDPRPQALQRFGDPLVPFTATIRAWAAPFSTAVAGVDFRPGEQAVAFAPGQLTAAIDSPVLDDDAVEGYESLCLAFAGRDACNATVTVSDDDAHFTVETVSVAEEDGAAVLELRRRDDETHPRPITVEVAPQAGAAAAGSDFAADPVQVTFAAGENVQRARLALVDDRAAEATETLTAVVRRPGGRALAGADKQVTVVVRDGDPAPAPPQPPAADRRAPTARLALARTLRLRAALRVPFTCSEACRATLVLRVDARTARRLRIARTIARATASGVAGRRATAALRLKRPALARLRRARRVRATLALTVRDGAGNARTVRRKVTLRR